MSITTVTPRASMRRTGKLFSMSPPERDTGQRFSPVVPRGLLALKSTQLPFGTRVRPMATSELSFVVGDCRSMPLKSKSVDLITSFETIEHIERQDEMVREFVRLLRPNGLLIVSSPDRKNYSEKTGYKNPFHVHELAHGQFVRLFKRQFRHVRVFRQRLAIASFILPDVAVGPEVLRELYDWRPRHTRRIARARCIRSIQ